MAAIPPLPPEGSVVADLATLKSYIGARGVADDVALQERLDAATEWAYEQVRESDRGHPDVQEAILLKASGLNRRRQAPEGSAGWAGEMPTSTSSTDVDAEDLLALHIDYTRAGLA